MKMGKNMINEKKSNYSFKEEEQKVYKAKMWIRSYILSNPNWVPSYKEISNMACKFKLTDGFVLQLYEKILEELENEKKALELINFAKTLCS